MSLVGPTNRQPNFSILTFNFLIIAAPSLTLRYSAQHGFHVHIAKIKKDDRLISQSPHVLSLSKSKSTHVYVHKVRNRGRFVLYTYLDSPIAGMACSGKANG